MAKKTLLLLRHAKSSWKDPGLKDRDRPLNGRGRRAAVRIRRLLKDERLAPDLVLCSTAQRARETADLVFDEHGDSLQIVYRDDLYQADPVQIASILGQLVEPMPCVMIIGHNPGLEEFLSQVTGKALSLPTAALARVDLELDTWNQFNEASRGTLMRLWCPREFETD